MANILETLVWQAGDLNNIVAKLDVDGGAIYDVKNPSGGIIMRVINRANNDRRPGDAWTDKNRNGIYLGDTFEPLFVSDWSALLKVLEHHYRVDGHISFQQPGKIR